MTPAVALLMLLPCTAAQGDGIGATSATAAVAAIAATAAVATASATSSAATPAASGAERTLPPSDLVEELDAESLRARVEASELLMLLFYAHTPAPAHGLLATAAAAVQKDAEHAEGSSRGRLGIEFGQIDVASYPEIVQEFGIDEPPKLRLYKHGKEEPFSLSQPDPEAIVRRDTSCP